MLPWRRYQGGILQPMSNIIFKRISLNNTVQRLVEPMKFNLVLECTKEMEDDIEFEAVYFGNARCEDYDQKIGSILVGPVPVGKIGFELETDPVDVALLNPREIFGVTSVMIIGRYKSQQFLRIGYFLNVRYPGVSNDELVSYEEDACEEEELGSTEGSECEDGAETMDSAEEEEEVEGEEDAAGEKGGVESGGDEDHDTSGGSSKHGSVPAGDNLESTQADASESPHLHCLRTREECISGTKYEKKSAQLEEELGEEVHESSFSEIEKDMDRAIDPCDEEDKIRVNGMVLDKSKIEIEFLEPPLTTVFEINWNEEGAAAPNFEGSTKRIRTSE